MVFKELCENRFSVRSYSDRAVEKEKLDYVLECGRLAPSACNRQPWTAYVVTSPDKLAAVKASYAGEWLKTAPVLIVVCAHHDRSWHREKFDNKDHSDIDMAIMADHMIMAATEQGLGTCWVCAFDPKKMRVALGLTDEDEEPVVMIPVGYAGEALTRPAKTRKSQEEVIVRL